MGKQTIPVENLRLQPFTAFTPDGVLLVSGAGVDHCNPMTIGWGMFGIMWGRPSVMVMVRPTRFTWQLITNTPDFTVNWMPNDWTDALRICGSQSGRNTNKFNTTGMTPVHGLYAESPIIDEAALSLECRLLYQHDLDPQKFIDPTTLKFYPGADYHGLFFGEIIAASGVDEYLC